MSDLQVPFGLANFGVRVPSRYVENGIASVKVAEDYKSMTWASEYYKKWWVTGYSRPNGVFSVDKYLLYFSVLENLYGPSRRLGPRQPEFIWSV